MRLILTLICALLLAAMQALPAAATLHAAMFCWVPDFEIAIACDDEDEGDGDESVSRPVPAARVDPAVGQRRG
jgi:hypothetical protein